MLKERSAICAADPKSGNYPLLLMQKSQIRDSCLGNYWVSVWGAEEWENPLRIITRVL
jgi:hypothetical protein